MNLAEIFPAGRAWAETAANDNDSAWTHFQETHGGTFANSSLGRTIYSANVDGRSGIIYADETGRFWFVATVGGRSHRQELFYRPAASLPIISPADWQGKAVPEREWYIAGLVPARTVTLLSGDGGVGKSLLALQLAAASALGVPSAGLSPTPARVLYLGAEDEADEFHRRLADITDHHGKELADLGALRVVPMADRDALLSVPDRAGVMQPTDVWKQFERMAREWRPGLVVLDTLADLFGGEEIKRAQARQFVAMLRKLAMDVDCAVLLLSHPSQSGMTSGSGSSGSTGWNNSVRSRLYLTKPDGQDDTDARVLTTMKANYGKTGDVLRLRWQDGVFVPDDGSNASAANLVARRADEVFLAVLSKLNRQGQNLSPRQSPTYAPKLISEQPEAKGVGQRRLAEAMQRLLDSGAVRIVTEGPPSRQRSRLWVSSEDFGPGRGA